MVVAVQDVVPVAEPRFGDRAVARYADPVLNIAYTVGRYLEGYLFRMIYQYAISLIGKIKRNKDITVEIRQFRLLL